MTRPELAGFSPLLQLTVQGYERYLPTAFDDSISMLEKVNKIIHHLNEIGKVTNDVVLKWNEIMQWLLDEGLTEEVTKKLTEWLNDGTLADLINNLLGLYPVHDYLSHQKVFGYVGNTENNEADFIQGIAFNQTDNELYVVRKDNTKADNKISRYDATTFVLKDEKRFATSVGAYNEGLPYFKDVNNDLCFIVRTSYDHNLAIFNYTKNTLDTSFVVAGGSKHGMDNKSKYYFSHFGDAVRTEGIFIYDFESVKNKNAKLLKKVYFPNVIAEGEKVQSIAILDDLIYLGHGKEYPEITVLNLMGEVIQHHAFNKQSLISMIQETYPDANLINFNYENEGVHFITEDGKILPVLAHSIIQMEKTYLTKIGNPSFTKVETQIYTENVNSGVTWKPVTTWGAADVTNYGSDVTVEYCKDDKGFVEFRGVATYERVGTAESTVYNKILFNIPFPYRPFRNYFFNTPASGGADRQNRIKVSVNGDVTLESVYDQGGTVKPFCVMDTIRYYVDSRTV